MEIDESFEVFPFVLQIGAVSFICGSLALGRR